MLLSGSSLIPSIKNFLALPLYPPYNSIIPFKYQKSGLPLSAWGIVFSNDKADAVSPVFARHYTLYIFKLLLRGTLFTK